MRLNVPEDWSLGIVAVQELDRISQLDIKSRLLQECRFFLAIESPEGEPRPQLKRQPFFQLLPRSRVEIIGVVYVNNRQSAARVANDGAISVSHVQEINDHRHCFTSHGSMLQPSAQVVLTDQRTGTTSEPAFPHSVRNPYC